MIKNSSKLKFHKIHIAQVIEKYLWERKGAFQFKFVSFNLSAKFKFYFTLFNFQARWNFFIKQKSKKIIFTPSTGKWSINDQISTIFTFV